MVESGSISTAMVFEIVGVPGTRRPGVSFGMAAAQALANGELDGFPWANAMGADKARYVRALARWFSMCAAGSAPRLLSLYHAGVGHERTG